MIKSVTVINHLGQSLKMELARPESSGFFIYGIQGLGPCKASVNVTEYGRLDGGYYSSSRIGSRNIVISLGFSYMSDIEEARHKSYKYFPLKKKVTLLIETDKRICETCGYVESNEPNIFSSEETTQISIVCPDPYLYAAGDKATNVTAFSGVESMIEFPLGIPFGGMSFGEEYTMNEGNVYYTGDADVGIVMKIHALGEASGVKIHNLFTLESMEIDSDRLIELTGNDITEGDDITISTVKGSKYATLIRDGVQYNIINCLGKNADWIQLTNGDNGIAFTAKEGAANLQFTIENRTVYEGV